MAQDNFIQLASLYLEAIDLCERYSGRFAATYRNLTLAYRACVNASEVSDEAVAGLRFPDFEIISGEPLRRRSTADRAGWQTKAEAFLADGGNVSELAVRATLLFTKTGLLSPEDEAELGRLKEGVGGIPAALCSTRQPRLAHISRLLEVGSHTCEIGRAGMFEYVGAVLAIRGDMARWMEGLATSSNV